MNMKKKEQLDIAIVAIWNILWAGEKKEDSRILMRILIKLLDMKW